MKRLLRRDEKADVVIEVEVPKRLHFNVSGSFEPRSGTPVHWRMSWRTGIVVGRRAHGDRGGGREVVLSKWHARGGDRMKMSEGRSTVLLVAGSSQCISMNGYFSTLAFWWMARPARYSSGQIEFRWFEFWWMNENRIRLTWPLSITHYSNGEDRIIISLF